MQRPADGFRQLPGDRRLAQVDLVLLFGLSRGLFARGDTVVSLSGAPNSGFLDTLLVLDVVREFPAFFDTRAAAAGLGDVEPQVLEKVLQLAVDLAREGREGRPVGTIFVIGDHETVAAASRQMVINPFRGYLDEEKNVLDPSLGETLKEFSTIDGAFVVRGDGVILSAGTFLKPERGAGALPSGLGARHAAAAAITAVILMKNWIMSMTRTPHSPLIVAKATLSRPTMSRVCQRSILNRTAAILQAARLTVAMMMQLKTNPR